MVGCIDSNAPRSSFAKAALFWRPFAALFCYSSRTLTGVVRGVIAKSTRKLACGNQAAVGMKTNFVINVKRCGYNATYWQLSTVVLLSAFNLCQASKWNAERSAAKSLVIDSNDRGIARTGMSAVGSFSVTDSDAER
jgi:hypothetical protein